MREIIFTVPGKPEQKKSANALVVAAPRSRQTIKCEHCNRKTGVRSFAAADKRNKEFENKILWAFKGAGYRFDKIHEGPVVLIVRAYFPFKAAWPKKTLKTAEGRPHYTRPDADRIVNQVMDALTAKHKKNKLTDRIECVKQGLWRDDSRVFMPVPIKAYSANPRTVVKIQLYDEGEPIDIKGGFQWPNNG